MKMKDARTKVENLLEAGIKTRAQLDEALPILTRLKSMTEVTGQTVRDCNKLIKAMSDACADYAIKHPTSFVDGLQTVDGVQVGDVLVGDTLYHLANGYEGYKRITGENMNQGFLGGLPKKWVKAKMELDVTGINRAGVTLDDLELHGLYRPAKNEWSEKE